MKFEDAGFVADLKSSYNCKYGVWGSGYVRHLKNQEGYRRDSRRQAWPHSLRFIV